MPSKPRGEVLAQLPEGSWTVREARLRYHDRAECELPDAVEILNPGSVAKLVREFVEENGVEHFLSIGLDGRNKLATIRLVSKGSPTAALVHPREIFQVPLIMGCSGVLLAHNHPSGNPSPSGDDDNVTRRCAQAGRILGIPVVDHVIVGEGRVFSYHEESPTLLRGEGAGIS